MNICLICLRSDRLVLKAISNVLLEFHYKLCDYSQLTQKAQYCNECEHLLQKFYEFHKQCLKALETYEKWNSVKTSSQILLDSKVETKHEYHPICNNSNIENAQNSDSDLLIERKNVEQNVKVASYNNVDVEEELTRKRDFSDTEDLDDDLQNPLIDELSDTSEKLADGSDILSDDSESLSDDSTNYNLLTESNEQINVESLKADLEQKFSVCGEILARDGAPIDKSKIMDYIENKMYIDLRKLQNAMDGPKNEVSPLLKDFLNTIHETYKEDKLFEPVFDIHYRSTCEIREKTNGRSCPTCKLWLRNYKEKHSKTYYAVYLCKLCPIITFSRVTMKSHFGTHSVHRCEPCNITYKNKSGLFRHQRRMHRVVRHVCVFCGLGFCSKTALKVHSRVHKNESPVSGEGGVRCEECDVTFPSQAVHEAHVADVHHNTNNLHENRKRKRKRSNPATPLKRLQNRKCRLCEESRPGGYWLRNHFLKMHPNEDMQLIYSDLKVHICDICGAGFEEKYTLVDHIRRHSDALLFACEMCPKRFNVSSKLTAHRRIHFPPAYSCDTCGKKYTQKHNLVAHIRSHNGERKHVCEICGKDFIYSQSLSEHIKGVHYNIRRAKKQKKKISPST